MNIVIENPKITPQIAALIAKIKETVAAEFGVPLEAIDSTSRKEPLPLIRHAAMSLAYDLSGLSLPDLTLAFNRENHQTIVHARKATGDRYGSSKKFRASFDRIKKTVIAFQKGQP